MKGKLKCVIALILCMSLMFGTSLSTLADTETTGQATTQTEETASVEGAKETKEADGQIVTNGGRVLGITAKGKDLKEARANAYAATEWVQFDNKYMRHDIGKAIDEA